MIKTHNDMKTTYIAFRSYQGTTLVSKATFNDNKELVLVDYKSDYVDFDQSKLNEDSTLKLKQCGVYAQYITEISKEEYESAIADSSREDNTSDVYVSPVEVDNDIVDDIPELNGSSIQKEIEFTEPGYYVYNLPLEKYIFSTKNKDLAREMDEDGISHIYVNENEKTFSI